MTSLLPAGAKLEIVLGYHVNPYSFIMRYDLWQFGDPSRAIYPTVVWYGEDLSAVEERVKRGEAQYLILHDRDGPVEALAARLGAPAPQGGELILLERRSGAWEKIKSWPIPPLARERPV